MLGPASLNGWTMSPVSRWKRLMSPHGVFQVPKSAASLSDAAASASQPLLRRSPSFAMYSSAETPALRASAPTRRPSSSPQKTASDVGTDVADQR